jgi:hypothetical protein
MIMEIFYAKTGQEYVEEKEKREKIYLEICEESKKIADETQEYGNWNLVIQRIKMNDQAFKNWQDGVKFYEEKESE